MKRGSREPGQLVIDSGGRLGFVLATSQDKPYAYRVLVAGTVEEISMYLLHSVSAHIVKFFRRA